MRSKNIEFLEKSKVKMAFTDKIITSYGGFSLLAKLFEKLELKESIEKLFPVREVSPNSKGVYSKVLKFGLTVIVGGRYFAHSIFLGDSREVYMHLFNVPKMVLSSTAITRMFNKIDTMKKSQLFAERLWEYVFSTVIPFKKIESDFVNFDSKVITRYGSQEGATKGYNPKKKGRLSHHPIIAFLNREKYIVNIWNREGATSSGNGVVEFLKETLARLDGRLNIKGCVCDSGFYKITLMKHLEKIAIPYILGVPLVQAIQKEIQYIDSWENIDKGLSIAEFQFQHKDEKWEKDRRYIVVRQEVGVKEVALGKQLSLFENETSRYRYTCHVTSFKDPAVEVWRNYRSRAADENIIKENTMDFALEKFSLNNFYATEAAMLMRVLFYNLINLFRKEILSNEESGYTLATIRQKYFVIPAQLGRDGREMILRMGVRSKKMKLKIKWILRRIDDFFLNPYQMHCS